MVKALVISSSIKFLQKLLEELSFYELNIGVAEIATSESEAEEILKERSYNIIFIDKAMPEMHDKEFLKSYKKKIILISLKGDKTMLTLNALNNINSLVKLYDMEKLKVKAARELEYVGYRIYYTGTQYLIEAIVYMYDSKNNRLDNLQSGIYPIIAKKYNRSVRNVKSSISKATEIMFYESDSKKVEKYFMLDEGVKPTVKQVIFTVINRIKEQK